MNEKKIAQFSMKRPEDKKNAQVGGILVLLKSIIISDWNNKTLKLFDLSCVHQSYVDSKHFSTGITAVKGDCFATYCSASVDSAREGNCLRRHIV